MYEQALLSKENLSLGLKITTDLGIAFCPFALEWFIHPSFLQRTPRSPGAGFIGDPVGRVDTY